MTTRGWIVLIIIIILIILAVWIWGSSKPAQAPGTTGAATSTATSTPSGGLQYDQNVSSGPVTINIPSAAFGLAVNEQQLSGMVHSYIPPCDQGFNYCLYDIATSSYRGTNFESAGISITHRTDLTKETQCLTAPPAGYSVAVAPAATSSGASYDTSAFTKVGNAAAGHFADDTLYRLYSKSDSSCFEFTTRVGQSDFNNYPAGAIKQFTAAAEQTVQNELNDVLEHVSLNGQENLFAGVMNASASSASSTMH
ncbi:MAG: hypothetical protein ACREGH_01775 [Minisyncoccia bacterium]